MKKAHIVAEWVCDACGRDVQLVLATTPTIGLPNQSWREYDISRIEYEYNPDTDRASVKESGPKEYHFCPTCSTAMDALLEGRRRNEQHRPVDGAASG